MSYLCNATARLLKPTNEIDSDDVQVRKRAYKSQTQEIRCSMRALSAQAAISALGKVSVRGYTCRLQTSEDVQPGWRISVRMDDETTWREYAVAVVRKGFYRTLTLEGGVDIGD